MPGLLAARRGGFDRAKVDHDLVVGEHCELGCGIDAFGAPRAGGAGQQQPPHLGLGPVQGLDQRGELVAAALGVVDDHQGRGGHLGQYCEIGGADVLTEHDRRPPLASDLPGEVTGQAGLALPTRTHHQPCR